MLKPEFKVEWLKRLRSKQYEQGTGFLRLPHGKHCCLGVACRILEDKGLAVGEEQLDSDVTAWDYRHIEEGQNAANNDILSFGLLFEMGLTVTEATDLADMNDSGRTFAEIADFIDANL